MAKPAPTDRLLSPFEQFLRSEAAAGVLLFVVAVFAFAWANSPWAHGYAEMQHTYFGVTAGDWSLKKSLLHWVNDGLMAIFFLLVGLELKRELLEGKLAQPSKASLAVAVAIGGMALPALLYVAFNRQAPGLNGWAIPMATDIAFALGVVALLGKRVPTSLKVLLTASAIVDDLGAVIVIAVFYTADLKLDMLLNAGIWFAVAAAMSFGGVRRISLYLIVGALIWYFTLKSGVHATIAGVALAFTIPIRKATDRRELKRRIDTAPQPADPDEAESYVETIEDIAADAQSPLHRLEHNLHSWAPYLVMPIFALFNAGVPLTGDASIAAPISLGVLLGLLVGKPVGALLFAWLATQLKLASLPDGANWTQLVGIGLCMGIGFTMSLFVTSLAFDDATIANQAKLGLLLASILAAIVAAVVLTLAANKRGDRAST